MVGHKIFQWHTALNKAKKLKITGLGQPADFTEKETAFQK